MVQGMMMEDVTIEMPLRPPVNRPGKRAAGRKGQKDFICSSSCDGSFSVFFCVCA
jgi:hypothetical protein